MLTLGAYIRERRLELGLTQEALANRAGDNLRQADVSRLEHDRVTLPRRSRLEALALALDVPIGTLLARSGWQGADDAVWAPSYDDPLREDPAGPQVDPGASPSIEDAARMLPEIEEAVSQVHDLVHQAEHVLETARDAAGAAPDSR